MGCAFYYLHRPTKSVGIPASIVTVFSGTHALLWGRSEPPQPWGWGGAFEAVFLLRVKIFGVYTIFLVQEVLVQDLGVVFTVDLGEEFFLDYVKVENVTVPDDSWS